MSNAHRVFFGNEEVTLTNREFELLAFLAQNPNIVFSREKLFERIWGLEALGDSATVTYSSQVTVSPTQDYTSQTPSQFESISHVYAKQVKVKVSWNFKGSTQSIEVSSVIR